MARRGRWHLFSQAGTDGGVFFPPRPITGEPPPQAERSGCGNWATLYAPTRGASERRPEAIRVWVRLDTAR